MADTRNLLQRRMIDLETILRPALTPLLRQQIREAIALHRSAIEASNLDPHLEDLNARYTQIEKRWADINSNVKTVATTRQNVSVFSEFLIHKLLEDYTGQPYTLSDGMLLIVDEAVNHSRDKNIGSLAYRHNITFSLEELALNTLWVEKKLSAAATRRGRPDNDIQPLVNEHDWPQLAATLISDREIAARLFEESWCSQELYERIVKGITHIQTRYFKELQSSTEYILNTHAAQLEGQTPPGGPRNILSTVKALVGISSEKRPRFGNGSFQLLQANHSENLKKIK